MMRRNSKNLAFGSVFVVVLLSGCALMKAPDTRLKASDEYWLKPKQAQPSGRAGALMLYTDYVRNLSASEYAHELDYVRQLVAQDKSLFRQLQYALILSAPGGDTRRAQQVIDSAANDNGDPELTALANMVSADLAERRRLEADTKRADVCAKRADELEKKVEAVKDIEKNMIGRDKGGTEKP